MGGRGVRRRSPAEETTKVAAPWRHAAADNRWNGRWGGNVHCQRRAHRINTQSAFEGGAGRKEGERREENRAARLRRSCGTPELQRAFSNLAGKVRAAINDVGGLEGVG